MNNAVFGLTNLLGGTFVEHGRGSYTITPFLSFKFKLGVETEIPLIAAPKVSEYTNEEDILPEKEYTFNYCIPSRFGGFYFTSSLDMVFSHTFNSPPNQVSYTSTIDPLVPHRYKGFKGIFMSNDDKLLILVTLVGKLSEDSEPVITGYKIYIDKSIISGEEDKNLSKYIIKKFIPAINDMKITPNKVRWYNYLDRSLSEIPVTIVIEDLQQYIHTCKSSDTIDLSMIPNFNIEAVMNTFI